MKKCGKCKEIKSISEFSKDKTCVDGLNGRCKPCDHKYYKLHKDKALARGATRRIRKYGITLEDREQMDLAQNGCCAICKQPTSGLVVDHCHITGKVRSLLCRQCNTGLGMFKDNKETLLNAYNYLILFQDQ